jgi:hypothetical protein
VTRVYNEYGGSLPVRSFNDIMIQDNPTSYAKSVAGRRVAFTNVGTNVMITFDCSFSDQNANCCIFRQQSLLALRDVVDNAIAECVRRRMNMEVL